MLRRRFIYSSLLLGGGLALPAWAQSGASNQMAGMGMSGAQECNLTVSEEKRQVAGRAAKAVLVNGQLPAPLLRWREGEEVLIRVNNRLREETSIHWHGILLPWQMDGVPGVSFAGIPPGESFTYRFPLKQAGTYWYHSHSGFQEQLGHYGPIIIEPREPDPVAWDREYVVLLSDWSRESPQRIFSKLKKMSDNYNFQQRTLGELLRDVRSHGMQAVWEDRLMWGDMRMSPTDLSDVTGATYTYLVNGHDPGENWTGLFVPGERVRLRFINASAMSIFNVRIPGLPMTVVQADGLDVQPVETDEFQIGTAETFDVVVQPQADTAYTIMCETNDRSGYARATLATREGMVAPVPPRRPRPTLTMKDMGMDHGHMDHAGTDHSAMDHSGMDHSGMDHSAMDHSGMDHSAMDHSAMDHSAMEHGHEDHGEHAHMVHEHEPAPQVASGHDAHGSDGSEVQRHDHPMGPGVQMVATQPVNRLGERPLGLEDEPHRVLVYTDLRSLQPNPDQRPVQREMELHLTANMERYMWSFDGLKFSEAKGPIVFRHNERLRLTLVNDTMMPHPIHLHGMFFDVVTGEHGYKPRKHTILVKPGEKMSVDITADAPGNWAFHCHLLYHMMAGMMQVVSVRPS